MEIYWYVVVFNNVQIVKAITKKEAVENVVNTHIKTKRGMFDRIAMEHALLKGKIRNPKDEVPKFSSREVESYVFPIVLPKELQFMQSTFLTKICELKALVKEIKDKKVRKELVHKGWLLSNMLYTLEQELNSPQVQQIRILIEHLWTSVHNNGKPKPVLHYDEQLKFDENIEILLKAILACEQKW